MENNINEKESRIIYADVLRIIAIFAVIIIHTASPGLREFSTTTFEWQIMNFYESLVRWAVPLFFMLSGIFFLDPKKEITTKKIYSKYIFRIFTTLFFWGMFYNVFPILKNIINGKSDFRIVVVELSKILLEIFFDIPRFHLWFLYAIIAIYILVPTFRIFTKNAKKEDFDYFMIIFAVFGLTLPVLKIFLEKFDFRCNAIFSIPELSGFVGYFFAGYYFANYEVSKKTKKSIFALGVLSLVFTIFITSFLAFKIDNGEGYAYFHGYLLPTTMFEVYSVFLLVKECYEKKEIKGKAKKTIIEISKLTFGIYLIHVFINTLFDKIGFDVYICSPIIMVPLRAFSNFCLSVAIIFVISKIPILKKYAI